MTDDPIVSKMCLFKAAILLYQSSLKCKNFLNLNKTQLFYLVIKLCQRLVQDEKLREVSVSSFFNLIITLLLRRY